MGLYDVLLGIDRAARDTGRRIRLRVRESDPISAAIKAERRADATLEHPQVEYTHAMRVRAVRKPAPAAAVALAA